MTRITQEERANLRRVAGFAENGKVKVIPLSHSCITDILDTIDAAEAENVTLHAQVSALLELNDAGMELMIACAEEEAAIAAHDDSAGRTPDTRQRLARAQANLQFIYDKVSNTREKCEALGLAVTPNQQVAHDA